MDIQQGGSKDHGVRIRLEEGERMHVLNPKLIVAFRGAPSFREDRLHGLGGRFRKKKWIQSDLTGPSEFILALPPGYYLHAVPVEEGSHLLFDIRNILFYSAGVSLKTSVLKMKHALVTRDLLKMKFAGAGTIGILSRGPLYEMNLTPDIPVFVEMGCLVAYPENSRILPCVYGNHLASQHMNYQWEIRGSGHALLQTGKYVKQLEEQDGEDGIIRRTLREVLPFGGVFIK